MRPYALYIKLAGGILAIIAIAFLIRSFSSSRAQAALTKQEGKNAVRVARAAAKDAKVTRKNCKFECKGAGGLFGFKKRQSCRQTCMNEAKAA